MQILFVHPNFPAQFGPVLSRLAKRSDVGCVFLSLNASGVKDGVRCIPFKVHGGAKASTHYCSRTFENAVWHAHAVYETCKAADLHPDLIVGHSGFGTTAFLRDLYTCPIINYFEYYYHAHGSDMDFRPDMPPKEIDVLRARARNAMVLLDLDVCDAGYSPTEWQRSLLPKAWAPKVEVIHDGIDTEFWQRRPVSRRLGDEAIPDGVRVVTYVARGFEAMRGFDIFIRVANRISAEMRNVIFIVVGADRIFYGGDAAHIKTKTFREHVLRAEKPDQRRFRFVGSVPPAKLVEIFSLSDLHLYLTVPFVLSWSPLNALACECVVLGSGTPPVREVIRHQQNGLLGEFFDVDGLASQALRVLRDPAAYHVLGKAGRTTIEERYSLDKTFPKMWDLFNRVGNTNRTVTIQ